MKNSIKDNFFLTLKLLPVLAFLLCCIYQIGFYSVVGYEFFATLSVNDFLLNSASYVPWAILLIAIGFGHPYAARFQYANSGSRIKHILGTIAELQIIYLAAHIYGQIFSDTIQLILVIITVLLTIPIFGFLGPWNKGKYPYGAALILAIPVLIMGTYSIGAGSALTKIHDNRLDISICVEENCEKVSLLNITSNGLLFFKDGNIVYQRKSDNLKISKEFITPSFSKVPK